MKAVYFVSLSTRKEPVQDRGQAEQIMAHLGVRKADLKLIEAEDLENGCWNVPLPSHHARELRQKGALHLETSWGDLDAEVP